MRERFKQLKKGELPTRQHFNRLSDVAQRFASLLNGPWSSRHTGSSAVFANLPPWQQFTLEITNTIPDESSDEVDGRYLAKIIWWSHSLLKWEATETKEWVVDARGLLFPIMGVGERFNAYFDELRGGFVPLGPTFLQGICLAENHPGRGTLFDVNIGYRDKADDSWVYYDSLFSCIDWRFGVPYPEAGATGLANWRWSDNAEVGFTDRILEVVALDCDTPGACTTIALS